MTDFEQWDNTPPEPAKHEGPKKPSPEVQAGMRAEKIKVMLWLLAGAGTLIGWLAWRHGWRPF